MGGDAIDEAMRFLLMHVKRWGYEFADAVALPYEVAIALIVRKMLIKAVREIICPASFI